MFRVLLNNKIGNILNYFASEVDYLSMTKALKLLYILDEMAVKQVGVPITWLEYKVWKNGPVADEIYRELRFDEKLCVGNKNVSIDSFVKIERKESSFRKGQIEVFLHPNDSYDFSEFSDFEIEMIKQVVRDYGNYNSKELIDILHKEDSLWHKEVKENNLKERFKLFGSTSNQTIDFSTLIENDEMLKLAAQSSFEALQMKQNLSFPKTV